MAELNPSISVFAEGVNNLLELVPCGEVEVVPFPCPLRYTVIELNTEARVFAERHLLGGSADSRIRSR